MISIQKVKGAELLGILQGGSHITSKVEAAQYVNHTAVVIELLQDSKEQTKQRMNMRGYGVALFTFLDVRVKN